ncbi:amino acid/polyamine/organocation transporter, APC superfamily [Halogranum gelatinilyticum]|uniref:Amino acid/polyamine/organocation transporter, APC superfamily n=1 Tax=Halogranum gelatinilyticum TaxID=660521 RepID=A0A1G9NYX3_9EURY|nr:amino acid permease [Halogranum gelatinilyticum]SDL91561.1 amino acid/polyamine/organocation transporter, APC superfamily [Halogranum gelatinilyticum]
MSLEGGELERTLGFVEAMTLGGGTMIGAGIFILPGIAAETAGPASALSYAIAGFVALLAALSLSELATGMPIAGGSYHYVNRALGGLFGSVVGWGMWTGLMFASAFYMIGFGQYLVEPIPFLDGRLFVVGLGLVGLVLLLGVNYYGTEESSAFQNVTIGVETAIILVFVAVGVFFIDPGNLEPFAPFGAGGVVATTGIVFISFLGFEIIATVAGEIKNPSRTIPLSMILSVVLVTILYVLVMLVSTGVIPFESLGDSPIPVSDVAVVYLGPAGVVAIVFAAIIAAISSSNSSILAASRVIYAMGRDGVVTDWFNVSHPRFYTPHRAIAATGGVTTLLILAGLEVETIIALLAEAASFSFLVAYSLVHVSLVVFRRADPDGYDPSFALPRPLYPAVPILGVVLSLVVVSQMATVVIVIGSGIVAFGVVWYATYTRGRVVSEGLLGEAIRGTPAEPFRVVVPVSNPATQHGLLRLAAASAHANADRGTPELVAVNVTPANPSPYQNVEADRAKHQRDLLENAHDIAAQMDVTLRTRAVVAPDVGEAILDVLEEEAADEVVLGWDGTLDRDGHVFGATGDSVVRNARCDVSLVDLRRETVGTPVALIAPGHNAPVVAHQAVEFAAVDGTVPTLLNVQPSRGTDESDAEERGRSIVVDAAEAAGLDPSEYDVQVVVADDVGRAVVEASRQFDTVCVGVSGRAEGARIPFGTVTERVVHDVPGNVVLVRGA